MEQTFTLYTVVHGSSWEDVENYTDIHKAKASLIRKTIQQTEYTPLLIEYIDNMGVFMHSMVSWLDLHDLQERGYTCKELDIDPSKAFDCIHEAY
jgi:hypothetical protein